MSKRFSSLNGHDFMELVFAGADALRTHAENVNALNVFPVPDGDTGTNMNLTVTSGVEELRKRPSSHLGKAAEALSKGLLMGARGNSGVILSQLFRGFAKGVQELESANVQQFAAALQNGVDTAYKAVVRPVEGTILTVSREAAKHGLQVAKRASDILELMEEVLDKGKETLARTPDMLPVLKQVGVVDAGGQGLIYIYEGFLAVLRGDKAPTGIAPVAAFASFAEPGAVAGRNLAAELHGQGGHEPKRAQAKMSAEDIEHGYCTEFMLHVTPGKTKGFTFEEGKFRQQLSEFGDSLLVVSDDELVKVHIHAELPGDVMNLAMKYGDLSRIKIENMRDQHAHIIMEEAADNAEEAAYGLPITPVNAYAKASAARKPFGFVAVAMGDGISEILTSVGVDVVLSGGQTMNPSTEDIVNAARSIEADTVFVLPNNSNIILAAQQAVELIEDKQIVVIPTKTIPQGLAAVLAFQENADAKRNEAAMKDALTRIVSGQVTFAVRDTTIDGMEIKEGEFIGIREGQIVASEPVLLDACKKLLGAMITEDSEIVTILTGADAKEEDTEALAAYIAEAAPSVEVETHPGGQPLYAYIFSVE
ncbi:DAK2 domain-containing protein [Paenibacillus chartarius]|uniref:DAK2 domain-containing protein n=1 Tax=Paenibacillus chartarius TaxID=747481 RepID=A0ABV6DTW8_9BACL